MISIADQVRRIAEKTGKNTERVIRETVFRLGQSIVLMTPVDTGSARGNWLHGIDRYDTAGLDRMDKGGGEAIAALSAGVKNFNIGETFYFTNSLPYIQKLEQGSSLQAPIGMVAVSVEALPMVLEQEIRRL